jgi:hypothetical protein
MEWQDQLADEVRELEGNGVDLAANDRARALLKIVRGFEVRLRQLAIRIQTSSPVRPAAPASAARPPRKPSTPLFRTFLVDQGVYTDDPEGVKKAG